MCLLKGCRWDPMTFCHHYIGSGAGLGAAWLVKEASGFRDHPDLSLESEGSPFQCRKRSKDALLVPSNYKDKKSLWGKTIVFIYLVSSGLGFTPNRFRCGDEGCHSDSREIYGQAPCYTFPPIAFLFMPSLFQFIQLLS